MLGQSNIYTEEKEEKRKEGGKERRHYLKSCAERNSSKTVNLNVKGETKKLAKDVLEDSVAGYLHTPEEGKGVLNMTQNERLTHKGKG